VVDGQPRAGATLGHPNTLGCFLSVGILILLSLKAREGMNNLLFYAGILILSVGMALTSSQNAILVALIPLTLLFLNRKMTKTVLLVLLITVIPMARLTPALSRISEVRDLLTKSRPDVAVGGHTQSTPVILHTAAPTPDTVATRVMLWESAIRMFLDRPVFGFGPGGVQQSPASLCVRFSAGR